MLNFYRSLYFHLLSIMVIIPNCGLNHSLRFFHTALCCNTFLFHGSYSLTFSHLFQVEKGLQLPDMASATLSYRTLVNSPVEQVHGLEDGTILVFENKVDGGNFEIKYENIHYIQSREIDIIKGTEVTSGMYIAFKNDIDDLMHLLNLSDCSEYTLDKFEFFNLVKFLQQISPKNC